MKILAIGDVHAPYIDPDALNTVLQAIRKLKPDVVVQVGDAYELDAFSNWAATGKRDGGEDELKAGREILANMWAAIHRYVPNALLIQTGGNHDARLLKRAYERLPEAAHLLRDAWKKYMNFPHVEFSDREETPIGPAGGRNWTVVHGHTVKGRHATQYAKDIICGHLHQGYVITVPGGYTELNAGWVGKVDHHSKNYARAKNQTWQHGYGFIDDLGPRFVRIDK